jgi:hypothetical protein
MEEYAEGSKWFCVCGYQNYTVLFGDNCRECGRAPLGYEPGIKVDTETGSVSWQCCCCFTKNYVDCWAKPSSCKCVTCDKIDKTAKVRHEAKKKELRDKFLRDKAATC